MELKDDRVNADQLARTIKVQGPKYGNWQLKIRTTFETLCYSKPYLEGDVDDVFTTDPGFYFLTFNKVKVAKEFLSMQTVHIPGYGLVVVEVPTIDDMLVSNIEDLEPDLNPDDYTLMRCIEIMWMQHPLSLMEPNNLRKNIQHVFDSSFPEIKLKVESVLELPSGNSLVHLTSKVAVNHILKKAHNVVYSIPVQFQMVEPNQRYEADESFLASLDEIWDETSVVIDLDKMPDSLRPQAKDLIMAKHVNLETSENKISASGAFEQIQDLRWELQGLYSGNVSRVEPPRAAEESVVKRESPTELDVRPSALLGQPPTAAPRTVRAESKVMFDLPPLPPKALTAPPPKPAPIPPSRLAPTLPPEPTPTLPPKPAPTLPPEPVPTLPPEPVPTLQPEPVPTLPPEPVPTLPPEPVPTLQPEPVPTLQPEPVPTLPPEPVPTLPPEPVPTLPPEPVPTLQPEPTPTLPSKPSPTPPTKPVPTLPTKALPTLPPKPVPILPPEPVLTLPPKPAPTVPLEALPTPLPKPAPTPPPEALPTLPPKPAPRPPPEALPTPLPKPAPTPPPEALPTPLPKPAPTLPPEPVLTLPPKPTPILPPKALPTLPPKPAPTPPLEPVPQPLRAKVSKGKLATAKKPEEPRTEKIVAATKAVSVEKARTVSPTPKPVPRGKAASPPLALSKASRQLPPRVARRGEFARRAPSETIADKPKAAPRGKKELPAKAKKEAFTPKVSSSQTDVAEPEAAIDVEDIKPTGSRQFYQFDPFLGSSDFMKKLESRMKLLTEGISQEGIPLTFMEYDYVSKAYSEEMESISQKCHVDLTPEVILNIRAAGEMGDPLAVLQAQEMLISMFEQAMPNITESTLNISFEETPIVQRALPDVQAKHRRVVANKRTEGYSLVGPAEEIRDAQDELIDALKRAEQRPLLEMKGKCEFLQSGIDIYSTYWQILLLKHQMELTQLSIRYDVNIDVQDSSKHNMKNVSIKQSSGTYNLLWQAHEAFLDLYQSVATNVASVSLESLKDLEFMKLMEDELTHKYKGLVFLEQPNELILTGLYSDVAKAVNDIHNLLKRKVFQELPNMDKWVTVANPPT